MTTKEAALDVIRQLPDNVTPRDVVTALLEALATEEALRRFEERGGIPDQDVTDEEWMAMICGSWADDLRDPSQDIYTQEDGGTA